MAKWDFSSVWRSPRCTDPGADKFACTKKTRVRSSRNPAPATPRRILRVADTLHPGFGSTAATLLRNSQRVSQF